MKLGESKSDDFSQTELNEMLKLIIEHKDVILNHQEVVKAIRK